MNNSRIIFMGTSSFSVNALEALLTAGLNLIAVYTQAPKPAGRNYKIQKSPVHVFAEERNIPVHTPRTLKTSDAAVFFRLLSPDLVVVSSYGLIIPRDILDIPTYGFINIHASLLPRWRGAAPIRSAILVGDKQTGITIMKMDAGIDTGDIIAMKSVDISPKTNHGELEDRLGRLGSEMIVDVLRDLEGNISRAHKQPEEGATYAAKISKESCKIDWNNPAEDILRQIRAFSPLPAAWCEIAGIRLKIFDAEIIYTAPNLPAGSISKGMIVSCGVGALKLTTIQPAGKNRMSGEDFLRGRRHGVVF